MTQPYLPGVPAPSDRLAKVARILAEIEWRERLGFDIGDLVEEIEGLLVQYMLDAVWAKVVVLPREAFV